MSNQKRTHIRVPLAVEVTLESEHSFYSGITNDIAEGGIFVATHLPPPIGAIVHLALSLPERGSWRIAGEVCWMRTVDASIEGLPPGCGIRFVEIPGEALRAIRAFVEERQPILYEAA